ncbi:hypothetical protein [Algibacillus agarilyticus]|uniref:hypothetical protein n=1 Tax=Algibacillus agarilyticus TaxID=2234133 RepID=UPI000DCF6635|nr:hypothetical protein [Algibacillus agarilyticus]
MKVWLTLIFFLFHSIAVSAEAPKYFDDSASGIFLHNSESAKSTLNDIAPNCGKYELNGYCFLNPKRNQKITFTFHEGSTKFDISEIFIEEYKVDKKVNYPIFPIELEAFITSKGIQLGISLKELKLKLGEAHTKNVDDYSYRVEFNPYILNNYNIPVYYGFYTFKENKLISFKYGFEYP